MWWILFFVVAILLYWLYEFVRDGLEDVFRGDSISGKLIIVSVVVAVAMWVIQLITGWSFFGLLAKLSLVAAVIVAVMKFVKAIFGK